MNDSLSLHDIHLSYRNVLNKQKPTIIIKEELDEEKVPYPILNDDQLEKEVPSPPQQSFSLPSGQPKEFKIPPYMERLTIENILSQPKFDLETELRNVCVKITLLKAIKYVPNYPKTIRECLKSIGNERNPYHPHN